MKGYKTGWWAGGRTLENHMDGLRITLDYVYAMVKDEDFDEAIEALAEAERRIEVIREMTEELAKEIDWP